MLQRSFNIVVVVRELSEAGEWGGGGKSGEVESHFFTMGNQHLHGEPHLSPMANYSNSVEAVTQTQNIASFCHSLST